MRVRVKNKLTGFIERMPENLAKAMVKSGAYRYADSSQTRKYLSARAKELGYVSSAHPIPVAKPLTPGSPRREPEMEVREERSCSICGKPKPFKHSPYCTNCWEVTSRLEEFVSSPNGVKYIRQTIRTIRRSHWDCWPVRMFRFLAKKLNRNR